MFFILKMLFHLIKYLFMHVGRFLIVTLGLSDDVVLGIMAVIMFPLTYFKLIPKRKVKRTF